MSIFRFEYTDAFQDQWDNPPDNLTTEKWKEKYGRVSNFLKTSKGSSDANSICLRLAHYLGFSRTPGSVVAADERSIPTDVTRLSAERLAELNATFHAETTRRSEGAAGEQVVPSGESGKNE